MHKIGFVGNGTDKFTPEGEQQAREIMRTLLLGAGWEAMVSGHSPVGGIDIWAEEEALAAGVDLDLKIPEKNQWDPPGQYGYKKRNMDIATDSSVLHIILADVYPEEYKGRRFKLCYHHKGGVGEPTVNETNHVKSGGCWTGKQAVWMGTETIWHIVENYPTRACIS